MEGLGTVRSYELRAVPPSRKNLSVLRDGVKVRHNGGMVENPNDIRVTLRIPKELHAQLAQDAKDEHRSLNGQLVYVLTKALGRTP